MYTVYSPRSCCLAIPSHSRSECEYAVHHAKHVRLRPARDNCYDRGRSFDSKGKYFWLTELLRYRKELPNPCMVCFYTTCLHNILFAIWLCIGLVLLIITPPTFERRSRIHWLQTCHRCHQSDLDSYLTKPGQERKPPHEIFTAVTPPALSPIRLWSINLGNGIAHQLKRALVLETLFLLPGAWYWFSNCLFIVKSVELFKWGASEGNPYPL